MSYAEDSEYSRMKENRNQIKNLVFTNSDDSRSNKKFCPTCIDHIALLLKEIDGRQVYWCHDCGSTFAIDKKPVKNKNLSKFQEKHTPMIISQHTEKKNPRFDDSQITDEDRADLRRFGYNI